MDSIFELEGIQKEIEIHILRESVEIGRLLNDISFELAVEKTIDNVSGKSEPIGKVTPSFSEKIKGVIDHIIAAIKNTIASIKDFFSRKENMEVEDYLNSATGQIQLSYNLKEVQDRVNREIAEGNKLVMAISKGTHIDPVEIDKFVRKCKDTVNGLVDPVSKAAKVAVPVATVATFYKLFTGKGFFSDTIESLKQFKPSSEVDGEGQSAINKIIGAVSSMVNDSLRCFGVVSNEISREAKKSQNSGK